jgi:hypothetical protein
MELSRFFRTPILLMVAFAAPLLSAQTNCDEGAGPLDARQPTGITVSDIISRFAAREAMFKEARNNYTYTQDISVQEFDGGSVSGEFRLVQDIVYDDKGNRLENVKFAPQSSLRQLILTKEDFDDFRNEMPFVLTTDQLPQYDLLYVGQQHVDEIDTYVFDIAPKTIEKGHRYFQGRAWVDQKDLQVVKTCGKSVPEVTAANPGKKKKKNVEENLTPKFVTYREQVDGQYWFPTYTSADDVLHFRQGDVHMRETIRYTNYKRFGAKSTIIYKGEVKPDAQTSPAAQQGEKKP